MVITIDKHKDTQCPLIISTAYMLCCLNTFWSSRKNPYYNNNWMSSFFIFCCCFQMPKKRGDMANIMEIDFWLHQTDMYFIHQIWDNAHLLNKIGLRMEKYFVSTFYCELIFKINKYSDSGRNVFLFEFHSMKTSQGNKI